MPFDVWALTKQIDELGGEWTYNLFLPRTTNFHFASQPVDFYEQLADFDHIGVAALMMDRARRSGLPELEIGSLLVDFAAYSSVFNPVDGFIPTPSSTERFIGRHTASVLRVIDSETVVVAHAWSGWTPDHTAKMTRSFFDEYGTGAQLSRPWNRGPLGNTAETLLQTSDPQEFLRLWRTPRKSFSEFKTLPEGRVKFSCFETWSLQSEAPAEVLTLELREGVRVGVGIIVHELGESSIGDLFIWPPYRRRGFGMALEGFAAERASVASHN